LYNKRIDPTDLKERTPDYFSLSTMKDPLKKPKSYINHLQVMNSVLMEKPWFSLFLHENMTNFYSDIEDLSKTLEIYSECDAIANGAEYSYAN